MCMACPPGLPERGACGDFLCGADTDGGGGEREGGAGNSSGKVSGDGGGCGAGRSSEYRGECWRRESVQYSLLDDALRTMALRGARWAR